MVERIFPAPVESPANHGEKCEEGPADRRFCEQATTPSSLALLWGGGGGRGVGDEGVKLSLGIGGGKVLL